jgi:KaiC/GvpD/RAD55 family RecA-like ATPase/predicted hydrocarbon binding protein
MAITEIQNIPQGKLLLLTGFPGAGKSTFCQQIAINGIATGLPVIYVTTESTSNDLVTSLQERGMGKTMPETLAIVDAFTQTVGLMCKPHGITLCANCADLNSLSIAVTKLRGRMNDKPLMLVFDSLTSPYLFNGLNVIKFIQQFLAMLALEGNAVVATMDAGCGKAEDLGAIMSIPDGIIQLEMRQKEQTIKVVKHPSLKPSSFNTSIARKFSVETALEEIREPDFLNKYTKSLFFGKTIFRPRLGDYVNAFWPKLAYWSGMLWDPQGFPLIIYENTWEDQSAMGSELYTSIVPQPYKSLFWLINAFRKIGVFPKDFSRVQDMKRVWWWRFPYGIGARIERFGIIEYLPAQSKDNEHHYRIYENSDCWELDGVGAALASYLPPAMAGHLYGLEAVDRMWIAEETKCIGLGDPFCEVKLVPGELDELQHTLNIDAKKASRIHIRLIDNFASHLLNGKLLTNRAELGPDIHLQIPFHTFGFPHIAGDRSRMAIRMGGAKSGKEIAERLLAEGLEPEDIIQRILQSLETLKAGLATSAGGKIKIEENIEPMRTKYMTRLREPSCYFTTGFLNGLYGRTHGLRIKETKCLAAGDLYCEWEII